MQVNDSTLTHLEFVQVMKNIRNVETALYHLIRDCMQAIAGIERSLLRSHMTITFYYCGARKVTSYPVMYFSAFCRPEIDKNISFCRLHRVVVPSTCLLLRKFSVYINLEVEIMCAKISP
jgi:hypothetical protein